MTKATTCPFCQSTRTHILSRSLQDYDNTARLSIECEDCQTASAITARATPEEKIQIRAEIAMREAKHAAAAAALSAKAEPIKKAQTLVEIFTDLFGRDNLTFNSAPQYAPNPPPKDENERGWLIEYQLDSGWRCWLSSLLGDSAIASGEASDGMRFARKQDAELFIFQHPKACSSAQATEHEWQADYSAE